MGFVSGILLLGAATLRASEPVEPVKPVALSGRAMGTTWSVKFVQPESGALDGDLLTRRIAERLEALEQIFSTYRAQSALSRFNAAASIERIPVAPEMACVASEARRISELSGGAFDVTVFPLVRLWGFGAQRRSASLPAAEEIASAQARVGWRKLEARLVPPALRKTAPDVTADFSSMAKGFAVDAIDELLAATGAANRLVRIGGDMKAAGSATGSTSESDGWRVAIEQPQPPEERRAIERVVTLGSAGGQALSTSGDYRNFFERGGRRYGHILDPRTGSPVAHRLASVSVAHTSCALSSAWATALFVLGAEEGWRVATEQGLACLFLIREGYNANLVRRATPAFEAIEKFGR